MWPRLATPGKYWRRAELLHTHIVKRKWIFQMGVWFWLLSVQIRMLCFSRLGHSLQSPGPPHPAQCMPPRLHLFRWTTFFYALKYIYMSLWKRATVPHFFMKRNQVHVTSSKYWYAVDRCSFQKYWRVQTLIHMFLFIVGINLYRFPSSRWRDISTFQWKQLFEKEYIHNKWKSWNVKINRDYPSPIEYEPFHLHNHVLVAEPSGIDHLTSFH